MECMRKHQTLEPISEEVVDRATTPYVGEFHGTSGPVRTSFNGSFLPIEGDFIKACDEVTGLSKKPVDPWSGDHIGFFNTLGAVARTGPNKGKRSYAARGYFEANAQRPNLHVLCEALVTSIKLDGDKATGVNFSQGGSNHTVAVNREVVVSCGALQSPQILELSGIGDPEVLKAAGVECKVENKAVGANFADHSMTVSSLDRSSTARANISVGSRMGTQAWQSNPRMYLSSRSDGRRAEGARGEAKWSIDPHLQYARFLPIQGIGLSSVNQVLG